MRKVNMFAITVSIASVIRRDVETDICYPVEHSPIRTVNMLLVEVFAQLLTVLIGILGGTFLGLFVSGLLFWKQKEMWFLYSGLGLILARILLHLLWRSRINKIVEGK
jgi:hypothetical protein